MPKPEDVIVKNFLLHSILYDDGNFSIAFGRWNDEKSDSAERLAMRWNGADKDPGYPKLFGKPVWFQIPEHLTSIIAKALKGVRFSKSEGIEEALSYIGDKDWRVD